MRTGNPVLNDRTLEDFGVSRRATAADAAPSATMTIQGTAQKTLGLLLLALNAACVNWSQTIPSSAAAAR